MNNCSNSKCRIDLYKHNLFCYKCGSKSINPKKNNNGRLFMKRLTHLYLTNLVRKKLQLDQQMENLL